MGTGSREPDILPPPTGHARAHFVLEMSSCGSRRRMGNRLGVCGRRVWQGGEGGDDGSDLNPGVGLDGRSGYRAFHATAESTD